MKLVAHTPEIRDLAHVPRWVIVRTNRQQNVAEHSYFVALLVDDMVTFISAKLPEFFVEERTKYKMIMNALFHDVAEGVTGDITGPVKNKIVDKHVYKEFIIRKEKELLGMSPTEDEKTLFDPRELLILKVADFLEAILFLVDEIKSGNAQLNKLFVELRTELDLRISKEESNVGTEFCSMVFKYVNTVIGTNIAPSAVNSY